MTDVVTRPGAGVDEGAGGPTSGDDVTVPTDPTYEWAPVEPEPRKRRIGLWIGIGAGAVAGVLAAKLRSRCAVVPLGRSK